MADRWLRSRSGTRDEDSLDHVNSLDMDSNNTCFESEANITVTANPAVEVSMQNSEDAANNSSTVKLSSVTTSQLQDLLATVMAAIQAESSKQTAAFQAEIAKQTETLKAQFKQENEKLATSLTERFEAANTKLREEFNAKLQCEIQNVSDSIDTLKRDTEQDINNVSTSVENLGDRMSERVNAHIVQTRKELDKQGQEVFTSSKTVLASISDHKAETESTVANLRQEINQNRRYVDSMINKISVEVRSSIQDCNSQIQSVKQANDSEVLRINNAISSLEAKITAGMADNNTTAVQETAVARTTTVGQKESITGTVGSDTSGQSVNGTNGVNSCNVSTCGDSVSVSTCGDSVSVSTCGDSVSVSNPSANSCNKHVNAASGLYANTTDLSELTLPTFTDSTSQVPLHFIRDLDQYFSLKRTPEELRLALVFRAVKEPFAKQWLSSAFDRMKTYEEFKKAFTELLWCPSRQASIRSAIYLDRHDPGSGESYLDHYIRYANMASTLKQPMSDLDLLSALTSHFEPRVQHGLICSNLQSTQDALAFLAKLQGLGNNRHTGRSPRRENDRRDTNMRPPREQDNPRDRDRGNSVNVRYVRQQGDRHNRRYSDRGQHNEDGRSFHRRGQGSLREDRGSQLNPIAPNFHPRDNAPQRS